MFDDLLNINKEKTGNVQQGEILISVPFLTDDSFYRSVVYIVENNNTGSIGYKLNEYSGIGIASLDEEFHGLDIPIYIGGPVEMGELHYIHILPELTGSVKIKEKIFWGGDFEQLKILFKTGEANKYTVRLFAGYSGWSSGQLQAELKEGAWLTGTIGTNELFKRPDLLWERSMEKIGGHAKLWRNMPKDPIYN